MRIIQTLSCFMLFVITFAVCRKLNYCTCKLRIWSLLLIFNYCSFKSLVMVTITNGKIMKSALIRIATFSVHVTKMALQSLSQRFRYAKALKRNEIRNLFRDKTFWVARFNNFESNLATQSLLSRYRSPVLQCFIRRPIKGLTSR